MQHSELQSQNRLHLQSVRSLLLYSMSSVANAQWVPPWPQLTAVRETMSWARAVFTGTSYPSCYPNSLMHTRFTFRQPSPTGRKPASAHVLDHTPQQGVHRRKQALQDYKGGLKPRECLSALSIFLASGTLPLIATLIPQEPLRIFTHSQKACQWP